MCFMCNIAVCSLSGLVFFPFLFFIACELIDPCLVLDKYSLRKLFRVTASLPFVSTLHCEVNYV